MAAVRFKLLEDYDYQCPDIKQSFIIPEGTMIAQSGFTSLYVTEDHPVKIGLPYSPLFTLEFLLLHPNKFKKVIN